VTTNDKSKLPRWAQAYIDKLESDLAYHREAYQAISAGDSPVRCADWVNPPLGLPERNIIEMDVTGGTLELALRDGVMDIRANDAILVQSSSGNVLKVWINKKEKQP